MEGRSRSWRSGFPAAGCGYMVNGEQSATIGMVPSSQRCWAECLGVARLGFRSAANSIADLDVISAHAIAAVLVVHAHLDARIAAKKGELSGTSKPAWIAQACLLAGAVICVAFGQPALSAPL